MNEVNLPISTDVSALAQMIADGTYSEDQQGLILRTVQTNLSVNLLNTLSRVESTMKYMDKLTDKIARQFTEQLEVQLDNQTLDFDTLHMYYNEVLTKQLTLLERQRQLVQSNVKLFPEDTMSPSERKLLGLLKSFSTQEQKQKFLAMVAKALEDDNDFSDEEQPEETDSASE